MARFHLFALSALLGIASVSSFSVSTPFVCRSSNNNCVLKSAVAEEVETSTSTDVKEIR